MRAALRRALLAAVLAAATVAVPTTAAAGEGVGRGDGAVVVPADGSVATTPGITSPGARYLVTVTGTFAYDRFGNLADCGSRDTDHGVVGQRWEPGGIGLTIDGAPADCPYSSTYHSYVFSVYGTGDRLRFAITDPTGYADNAGALEVAVATTADDENPSGSCHYAFVPIPDSPDGDLSVTAAAWHTSTADGAWWLEVECLVYVGGSLVAVARREVEAAPAVADSVYVPSVAIGPVRRCLTVRTRSLFGAPLTERNYPCV